MASEIKIPDFDFAAFYYPEFVDALLAYKRVNIPEITTEAPQETSIQLIRAFALVGHTCMTNLDLVANEVYQPSAKLRSSVVRQQKLIGFVAKSNIPATSDLRAQLTRTFAATTLVVPDNSLFGTRRRAESAQVSFEADEALSVSATDVLVAAWRYDNATGIWTNQTSQVNSNSVVALIESAAEKHFYFAHDSAMTNTLVWSGITQALDLGDDQGTAPALHFQYFDGELEDERPDLITIQTSNIRFDINDLVGAITKVGTFVHVFVNSTGATERLAVQFDTVNFIETTAFLSQTVVSTDPDDYTVGSYWHDISLAGDTTTAAPTVAGEGFDTGGGAPATFGPHTLVRWPLQPSTIVTWSYLVGGTPTTATFDLSDGSIGGDAAAGTTVTAATGSATLVTTSAPDAATPITVAYSRVTQQLQQDGTWTFSVPFDETDNWVRDQLPAVLRGGTGPTATGHYLRLVISAVGAGALAGLNFDRILWDSGDLFVRFAVTQGRSILDEVIGNGDGTVSQSFKLAQFPVIEGSVDVFVDDEQWTQVVDFLSSTDVDEHYVVEIDSDGVSTVRTGDGINGKIVPIGTNNVESNYRIGAEEDGNVGASQIIVNQTGIARVQNITNPRAAGGWVQQEGATEESLEKLKRDGSASLRVLKRAVTPPDIVFLTTRFVASDDRKPYSRARAVENGFGLKTVKLIVVPVGGTVPSLIATREELELSFNGNLDEGGVTPGSLVTNHRVTAVDYTPKLLPLTAVVTGGDEAKIRAALIGQVQPEAVLAEDGVTFRWAFGQTVTPEALNAIIFGADSKVTDVDLSIPAADTILADDELPLLDLTAFSLTVN